MIVRELKEKEMMEIDGGTLTSSFINAIANIVNVIFDIGKETGSAIRRLTMGNYCSIN